MHWHYKADVPNKQGNFVAYILTCANCMCKSSHLHQIVSNRLAYVASHVLLDTFIKIENRTLQSKIEAHQLLSSAEITNIASV